MKKTIYFITGNQAKLAEARTIFNGNGVNLKSKKIKLKEPRSFDQEEVVLEKARQAFCKLKKPVIVDDTGIYFDAYPNFPGTYTKTFFKTIGFRGIKNLLKGEKRGAYFETLICYKDSKVTKVFSGRWRGRIVSQVSRFFNPDWQYNSIFIPEGFNKPLVEVTMEERAKHSHRRKAFDEMKKYFAER